MYGPIKKLTRVNANLQQAAAAAERVFELMDAHTEVVERPGAVPLPPFSRSIEYRDVSFGYEDGHGKLVAERRVGRRAGRPRRGHRRSQRRRQDHAGQPAAAVLRRVGRGPAHRRARRARRDAARRCAGRSASSRRTPCSSTTRSRLTSPTAMPDASRRADRGGGARRQRPRLHPVAARRVRDARSASAASACRAASGSAWPSPAPCCATPRSSSSTRRPRRSTPSRSGWCRRRSRR